MPGSCPWGHRVRGWWGQAWSAEGLLDPEGSCVSPPGEGVTASAPQTFPRVQRASLSRALYQQMESGRTGGTGTLIVSQRDPRTLPECLASAERDFRRTQGARGWGEVGQVGCGCPQREVAARPRPAPPLRIVRRGHQRAGPPLGTPWRKDGVGEPAGPPLVVPPTCLPHRPAAATPCESPAAVTLSPSRSHRGDIW